MSAAASLSEPQPKQIASHDPLAAIRVNGAAALDVHSDGHTTRITSLTERGGYRIKFPTPELDTLEACIVNTGGGVAGGDCVSFNMEVQSNARLRVTTPSAERIYRSLGDPTRITTTLKIGSAAELLWQPGATILFSGARLARTMTADVATDATLVIAETVVFGRRDSGETMGQGLFNDKWSLRRDGKFVFADATRLDGDIGEVLARRAVLSDANIATLIVAIAPDISERLDAVRSALASTPVDAGASTWNGILTVRIRGHRLDHITTAIHAALAALKPNATNLRHQINEPTA